MPTILVVDNDTDTLAFVERKLTADGHKVEMVTSARSAVAVLSRVPVDLVLLEVILPDMEGVEAILALQRRWPALPVVAMSGGGARVSANHALKLAQAVGARGVLHKPFSGADLSVALDGVLGRVA